MRRLCFQTKNPQFVFIKFNYDETLAFQPLWKMGLTYRAAYEILPESLSLTSLYSALYSKEKNCLYS